MQAFNPFYYNNPVILPITKSGNTISWYTGFDSGYYQLNTSGNYYVYFAMG